jgi:hypothetical protein
VSADAPDGWEEVFGGPCLEAGVVQAALEANGLEPVNRQLEASDLWPTIGLDECRVYVPTHQADAARQLVRQHHES